MSIFAPSRSRWTSRMLSVVRIVAGVVFVAAGTMKLFGFPPLPPGQPPITPMSQMWIGAILEVVGGTAIVLGPFTRPVAFVLAGEMAVAYLQFHFPQSPFPTVNNGIPARGRGRVEPRHGDRPVEGSRARAALDSACAR